MYSVYNQALNLKIKRITSDWMRVRDYPEVTAETIASCAKFCGLFIGHSMLQHENVLYMTAVMHDLYKKNTGLIDENIKKIQEAFNKIRVHFQLKGLPVEKFYETDASLSYLLKKWEDETLSDLLNSD